MSFKLTYSTMFNPPPELHTQFDAAMARLQKRLGEDYALHVAGKDRNTRDSIEKRNPADQEQVLGRFAAATAADVDEAMSAADRAFPAWKRTPASERMRLLRRVGELIEERVYDI